MKKIMVIVARLIEDPEAYCGVARAAHPLNGWNMVKIIDLKHGMRRLDIIAEIVEKSERTVRGEKPHSTATIKDTTGEIALDRARAARSSGGGGPR